MKYLRIGLGAFFLLVVLEGAFRKWVFPGQQQLVYLVKDVWLLLLIVGLAVRGYPFRLEIRGSTVGFCLAAYSCYLLLESLNPGLPSLTLGLWGLRSHVLYAGLVWLIPAAFRSSVELAVWLRRAPVLAVPVFLLGIVQFFAPVNSVLNRYAAETDQIASFGGMGAARITGTFPYISGMTTFLFAILLVSVIQLIAGRKEGRWQAWIALALGAVVVPMTGARWSLYVWALVLPLFAIEMMWTFPAVGARFARLTIALGIALAAVTLVADSALTAFTERTQSTSDGWQRLVGPFYDPVQHFDEAGLFGFGAGSTHQAATAILPDRIPFEWLPTTDFESESGRLMLELGLIGVVLAFALKVAWLVAAHAAVHNARDHSQLLVALVALGFFAAHLMASVVFNATAAAIYWGLAGALAVVVREQAVTHRAASVSRVPLGAVLASRG